MGISQLLPLLESGSTRQVHLREFRGSTVAVDSYCWLHRGARGCALKLAMQEPTTAYVDYCLKYVKLLLDYGLKPIMVFDGRTLPAKLKTEKKRQEAKKLARSQGVECLRLGQRTEAYKYFCQCIEVTPEMALNFIKKLREMKIDCIVAPYEADAQLAFFSRNGIADIIITEDSDLLLFGCRQVLYKLDLGGVGQLVNADLLYRSMHIRPDQYTFDKFRHMCILSGCDYVDNLPGVGLKKALKFITMTAETRPEIFLDRIPRYLKMKQLQVSEEYKQAFFIADATFLHQTVFDTTNRTLIPLTPVAGNEAHCINAGEIFDNNQAFELALGNLNPANLKRMSNWYPILGNISDSSIWRAGFAPTLYSPSQSKAHLALCKIPDNSVIDHVHGQRDEQLEKELEFYKLPPPNPPVVRQKSPPTSPLVLSPKTSPVLSNPFFKRYCRVPLNGNGCDKKVVSRFFSNDVGDHREPGPSPSWSSLPHSENGSVNHSESDISPRESRNPNGETSTRNMDPDVMVGCKMVLDVAEGEIQGGSESGPSPSADAVSSLEDVSSQSMNRKSKTEPPSRRESESSNEEMSTENMDPDAMVECEVILDVAEGEIQGGSESGPSTSASAFASLENLPSQSMNRKRKAEHSEQSTTAAPKKKVSKQVKIDAFFKRVHMN